jgi:hypothetical protein
MNGADMDEISLVTALRPGPPADAEQIRQRARGRLEVALTGAGPNRQGRLSRNRRWLVVGAAAAAVALGAVIAVPAALPGSGGSIVTKAWAVTRSPDGSTVTVTIDQTLSDWAGLQRALRAEGVPAYVRPMTTCGDWLPPGGLKEIRVNDWKAMLFPAPGNNDNNFSEIVIHPAALPKGWAVFIGGGPLPHGGLQGQMFIMPYNRRPVCVHPTIGSSPVQGHG